ncbi:single-strand binding protein [Salsuginibacillus halophilus]|uniref:Single-stranded DNA-binding protein n=1 Tax=Salsuginibacillus halophilus TaxID=517424 RepID=A0A2P8H694_9BACI|nr:single-stranded DNA-binding protein [Salsuginibacillus halophilus]PSL41728.1 single-strand binding protein [Salsuginibacillus halophilus]
MINNITLVGRLTRDAELRFTANGVGVANFGIAVNRPFKNQQGENEVDFFNCVAWRKLAENVAQYVGKGSQVAIVGRLQSRRYENKEGQNVTAIEVVAENVQFLDTKGGQKSEAEQDDDPLKNNGNPIDIGTDDLPF